MSYMNNCSSSAEMPQYNPMPIIGLYAAGASLLCVLAMFLNSAYKLMSFQLCNKYMRFSNKFFALNATSLTLLAVATKLTGDLTAKNMETVKFISIAFLTTAMGNFFTTLASMPAKDILTNVTALSILVTTVIVNLCIQRWTGILYGDYILMGAVLLFSMFIMIVSTALAVPAIKKCTESKFQTIHNIHLETQQHTFEDLRLSITKYSVMAASSSPQFMLTRLVTFVFASNICLVFGALFSYVALYLILYIINCDTDCIYMELLESDYKWSLLLILLFQSLALLPGSYMDALILLSIMRSKYEDNGIKLIRQEFTIESYWTEKLLEWKYSSIPMRIKRGVVKKFLYDIKYLILTFCIGVQTVVIICCKFICVVSFYTQLPFVFLLYHLDKLICKSGASNDGRGSDIDHNCYAILLEGEKRLSQRLLRNIVKRVDEEIKRSKMKQPQNLFNLLKESFSFRGVIEFDSNRVPSLLSNEPPNCWTLPVVTLTSIAIALPNIATQHVDWLLSSVDEGLRYASLIDVLDEQQGLKNIKNAADLVWVGVDHHNKWLDMNLKRKTEEINSVDEIIQSLANVAERIVLEFKVQGNINLVENPLYWPANVLAANSMYRISRNILLYYENGECQAEELFRKLICMIADILAACLTNLPHLIATKCRCKAIEERENSVHDAAILLGETEDILKHFEERQLLSNVPNQPLCIDEWRRWMERQDLTVSVSTTSNGTSSDGGLLCV